MNEAVSKLVEKIRYAARGRIDGASLENVLEEVRAHLDASIQARLEMGIARETAVRETIAEFGDPLAFARKMAHQHPADRRQLFDRPSAIAMFTGVVLFSIFETADHSSPIVYPVAAPFIAGAIAISLWILVTSWRAKFLPILSLLAAFLIGIPILASFGGLSWLPGRPQRLQTEKYFAQAETDLKVSLKAQSDFAASANLHFFSRNGAPNLKIIWKRSPDDRPDTFQYVPAATPAEAAATWQKILPRAYSALDVQTRAARDNISSYAEDLDKSYLQHVISGTPEAVGESAGIALGMFYLSALSWLTHFLGRAFKRSARPKGMA